MRLPVGNGFFALAVRRPSLAAVPPLAAVLLLAALMALAACGGGSGTTDPPVTEVVRVEVTAPATSVPETRAVQFSARAESASGAALPGRTFTWQSSNAAVATVDGSGLVRGVAPGSATITAVESTSGTRGTLTVTVSPAVGSVSVSAPQTRVKSGKQLQLSVVLTDGAGHVLTGREVTWSTSAPALATVSGAGVLTTRAPGNVTITATSGGKSGSVALEVFQLAPVRITLAPTELKVLGVGDTVQVRALAVDREGDSIPSGTLPLIFVETRRAGLPVLGAAGEPGVYRGTALGHATLWAELGGVSSNPAVIAVLGGDELLATAVPDSSRNRRAGSRVTVPVVLDMSRAGNPGDLGALELEIGYDPSSLVLKSTTPGVAGSISEGGTPGRYRFAFASSSPAATARLTVVTLVFEVAAAVRPGTIVPLSLTFPSAPASTGFAAYPHPVVVSGDVRITAN